MSDGNATPPAVGQISWQIVDWDPERPFGGHLVFQDDTGPLVWCALEPILVRELAEAMTTINRAQRDALLGGPVQPDAPLNVAAPSAPGSTDVETAADPGPSAPDVHPRRKKNKSQATAGHAEPASARRQKSREDDPYEGLDPEDVRKAKRVLIGRIIIGGALLFALADQLLHITT